MQSSSTSEILVSVLRGCKWNLRLGLRRGRPIWLSPDLAQMNCYQILVASRRRPAYIE
ncbi:hypothetical protein HDE71_000189 [Janthinobacterium sp. S3M3]|nr:hypothetical protein [Janthinobacterium sp. S3T4]MBB5611203.1 hypothetical protein [Janthinobacterium sp. S3M3]